MKRWKATADIANQKTPEEMYAETGIFMGGVIIPDHMKETPERLAARRLGWKRDVNFATRYHEQHNPGWLEILDEWKDEFERRGTR